LIKTAKIIIRCMPVPPQREAGDRVYFKRGGRGGECMGLFHDPFWEIRQSFNKPFGSYLFSFIPLRKQSFSRDSVK
jgi:hypothetical protein